MKEDKTLVCRECGTEFVFSASEQEFYEEKGFTNEPGRCLVAVKLANNVWASTTSARLAKCSMLLAQNAVKTPKYRSVLPWIVRYTAANASMLAKANKLMKLKNQLLRQLVFSLVNRQFYGIISE